MAFKSLKNHITSLSTPFLSDIAGKASNFMSGGSQKSAGKVAAQLLKKGPFDIPDSPSQQLRQNPLSFNTVQYPLDLGSNELGHYILFESGFVGYSPQTDGFLEKSNSTGRGNIMDEFGRASPNDNFISSKKISAKLPSRSITTSGIALYMPQSIKASYTQSYDSDEATGLTGDMEATANAVKGSASSAAQIEAALKGVIGGVAREAKTILGEFVSLAGVGDPVRFAAKRAGVAVNPRSEAFYNSPQQRTFSFDFDFWPRNEAEARAVRDIIKIFKYNSSPGFKDGLNGSVFTIPNYWKISYMFQDGINDSLNRIGACYCTDVEVNYTPDGEFRTFGDGSPVHTKLTVSMLEDKILSKQDIEAGA